MLRITTLLRVLLYLTLTSSASDDNCVYNLGARSYDLTNARHSDTDYQGESTIKLFGYSLNFCGPVITAGPCKDQNGQVCQFDYRTKAHTATLAHSTATSPAVTLTNSADPRGGLTLTWNNGDTCSSSSGPKQAIVRVVLNCGNPSPNTFQVDEDTFTCTYTTSLSSPAGCPVPVQISFGTAMLLAGFGGMTLYCCFGTCCRLSHGHRGGDALPHRAFWNALPGLIRDGCRLTWSKCSRIKPRADYNDL